MRKCLVALLIAALIYCAACSSGGNNPDDLPAQSALTAAFAGGTGGVVYGPPGSADAGTQARVVSPAGINATVAVDGSFRMALEAYPTQAIVAYVKQGVELQQTLQFAGMDTRVIKPFFTTGSAPNDMLLADSSLYIANSLDNTVVRYAFDGAQQASASFAQFASPSFLVLSAGTLWAVTNGDNSVTALDALTLTALPGQVFSLTDPAAAFIGPSQPCVYAGRVFVPRSQILTFAPTTYSPGLFSVIDETGGATTEVTATGVNAQYSTVDTAHGLLYIVCTGDIQFDEQFHPYAQSDSIVDIYDVSSGTTYVGSINLGQVGVGRLALSPDGATAFVGNGLNGNMYQLNLASRSVIHGAANPIVLTEEFTYIADVAYTPDGQWLLATSFNTDELYVIDPRTGEVSPGPYLAPFDLALAPDLLAGSSVIEIGERPEEAGKYDAYILYAVANAVAKVRLY